MKLYAILHKPTGHYLPYRKDKKGFTADEPIANCIPRLFKRRSDANCALNWWLKGVFSSMEGSWLKGWSYGVEYGTKVEYKSSRKAEDMAVVVVTITLDKFSSLASDEPSVYQKERIGGTWTFKVVSI